MGHLGACEYKNTDKKQLILMNGQIKELTDTEINLLRDALMAIDYSSLPNDIEPCCCDTFNYDLTISSTLPGINGRAVWTDCTESNGQVAAELIDLNILIIIQLDQ